MTRLSNVSPIRLAFGTLTALLLFGSAPVMGHSLLVLPKPRDQQDGYKDPPRPPGTGAPCGVARAATQPATTYVAGQPLHVQWSETITHPGCFVIDFASANDASFQILGVKSHSTAAGGNPRPWSLDIVLPTAPCTACTLRLRQLMLAADVPDAQCPPATIPVGTTYYSCANVALTGNAPATTPDAGVGDARADAGGPTGSAGRGGIGSGGTTPVSSGGSTGGIATGGTTGASGGSTSSSTGTGGATVVAGSGGRAPGSANGATGGSAAPVSGTGGSTATGASPNSGGGCSISGAASSASMLSVLSGIFLAGAFIVKRRRPSDPKTKERLQ